MSAIAAGLVRSATNWSSAARKRAKTTAQPWILLLRNAHRWPQPRIPPFKKIYHSLDTMAHTDLNAPQCHLFVLYSTVPAGGSRFLELCDWPWGGLKERPARFTARAARGRLGRHTSPQKRRSAHACSNCGCGSGRAAAIRGALDRAAVGADRHVEMKYPAQQDAPTQALSAPLNARLGTTLSVASSTDAP